MFCVVVSPPDLRILIVNEASAMERFVEHVFDLYEEYDDTPNGSLVFTVCTYSTYTAPALVFSGQSRAPNCFCLSSGASSTGVVLEYKACLSSRQRSSA